MTRQTTSTGKFNGPPRQAQIRLKDLANSFCCTSDQKLLAMIDETVANCLRDAYAKQNELGCAELWTDGSYDERTHAAGIGILIRPDGRDPDREPIVFGKSVRASSSQEAELYAMAVGLSYLLDTCPGIRSVRLRYDCLGASVTAANIDAYAGQGAPYTNFRHVLKRCRKAGVTVLFQHVKSHAGTDDNELCDLLARYYAKARLDPCQKSRIARYTRRGAKK